MANHNSEQQQKVLLELSIEETNQLRAKLGLTPLRIDNNQHDFHHGREEPATTTTTTATTDTGEGGDAVVLELSITETNELRKRLGLRPLRTTTTTAAAASDEDEQPQPLSFHHKPAENMGDRQRMAQRLERSKLERQVQMGIAKQFAAATPLGRGDDDHNNKGEDDDDQIDASISSNNIQSWAAKMRAMSTKQKTKKKTTTTTATNANNNNTNTTTTTTKRSSNSSTYTERDLEGMKVSHDLSELEAGATTVLTLADAPLLKAKYEDDASRQHVVTLNELDDGEDNPAAGGRGGPTLENVLLTEQRIQHDGLRQKRKLELGMGRAGGYAGFDDDEFEEMGGTQRAATAMSTVASSSSINKNKKHASLRGFHIGSHLDNDYEDKKANDLFASFQGKAISLESASTDVMASDFMTAEEEEAIKASEKQNKKKTKNKTKDTTKFKKKSKKEKKKHKRTIEADEEEDDDDEEVVAPPASTKSLLQELEDSAATTTKIKSSKGVKRRRTDSDDDIQTTTKEVDDEITSPAPVTSAAVDDKQLQPQVKSDQSTSLDRRSKYDQIMNKGNLRTKAAFQRNNNNNNNQEKTPVDSTIESEEPDDAFLQAALAKARRLQRLKEMTSSSSSSAAMSSSTTTIPSTKTTTFEKGADAVMKAVQNARNVDLLDAATANAATSNNSSNSSGGGGTIIFAADDTREFTRALRIRAEQAERRKKEVPPPVFTASKPESIKSNENVGKEDVVMSDATAIHDNTDHMNVEDGNDGDMTELAKQVKEEQTSAATGVVGGAVAPIVGRGLSGVISMLQQTGEISGKRSGKEELRGRAKDKRHYEDYEPLDLPSVVQIDDRYATDKDREMAHREIQLEYRDRHGRLLTRKEAYRDLCYQFHGHGSSKKREDKRMKQIALEQAEARLASRQVAIDAQQGSGTTLGALKATQQATGKAFVVHKT